MKVVCLWPKAEQIGDLCALLRPTKFALGSQAERLEFEWALVLRNSLP